MTRAFSARAGVRPRWWLPLLLLGLVGVDVYIPGCSGEHSSESPATTIRIGISLPFTGQESAMGRNLEQALILAVEDVNRVGGVGGQKLELVTTDSNSGMGRGLNELLSLLYDKKVKFLIGPHENNLARNIVTDLKGLDVFNILPGYAAPSIERVTTTGAWLRLAPTPFSVACGLGSYAYDHGVRTANTLSTTEDYNTSLATDFAFQFATNGGTYLPSSGVLASQNSFETQIRAVLSDEPNRTLLIAYPATAARIVADWTVTGLAGSWYLSPLLHTEVFLSNIPYRSLDGAFGLSPTLSLSSECAMLNGYARGAIPCGTQNRERFSSHFAERWGGAKPFQEAHFYYDALVLLALGMRYSLSQNSSTPTPKALQQIILQLNKKANAPAYWFDLDSAMRSLGEGEALRYVGAAAEYEFDRFGNAQHRVFDRWTIRKNAFVEQGAYYAYCLDRR